MALSAGETARQIQQTGFQGIKATGNAFNGGIVAFKIDTDTGSVHAASASFHLAAL